MTRTLPATPSLEQLKNQAKDLYRACRNRDAQALSRIRKHAASPPEKPPIPIALAGVLHVIAREYGFESWPKLKKHVQFLHENAARRAYLQQQVERFSAPRGDWRTLLAAAQELDRAGQAGLEAVVEGLSHPSSLVRRQCAGYLDHHGTEACVSRLEFVALHDPVPNVRRTAVHSLTCLRCKPCPLTGDIVGFLVQVALSDPNMRVRQEAVSGLGWQPPDARAIAGLNKILQEESNNELLRLAHFALKRQDPEYRKAVDERARQRGLAAARQKADRPS
jgi:HEAT repeat protein